MKSLLPLIALALFVGCEARGNHFKLPPFRLFDKNSDGTFTPDEVGKLMIDGARVLTMVTGKKLYKGLGYGIPEMRDGKLTEEEYQQIEDSIRKTAKMYLEQLKQNSKEWQGQIEVI